MKKLLALILAIMMIATLSVTAFAADDLYYDPGTDTETATGTSTGDVEINFVQDDQQTKIYYVVVTWKDMDFTYAFGANSKWDPETHQYINNEDGKWYVGTTVSGEGAEKATITDAILVENHSNNSVNVGAAFTNNGGVKNGVTAEITQSVAKDTLPTAEGTAIGDAPELTFNVSVSGVPTSDAYFVLDTITVTVSKP